MKRSVKYISLLMILALSFVALPLGVYASDNDIRPASIEIRYNNRSISTGNLRLIVARGDEVSLDYRISPAGANVQTDVAWRSSNTRVADVDDGGRVIASEPGESTISVRTENGRVASALVYVPRSGGTTGRVEVIRDVTDTQPNILTSPPNPLLTTPPPANMVTLSGQVPREVLLNAVRLGGSGTPAALVGYESVSHESLMAAARLGNFPVRFDAMLGDTLVGRITLAPNIANNPAAFIRLGVYSQTANTSRVQGIFDRFFSNAAVVILVEQDRFPGPVEISARAGMLSGNNLHFYSYNPQTNTVSVLSVTGARTDTSNYIHFITSTGGYIIVSDGPLTPVATQAP